MKKSLITLILLVLIVSAGFIYVGRLRQPAPQAETPQPIATAHYVCNEGKTIDASYFDGPTKEPTSAEEPPIPGGSAHVALSDGRTMTLPQTISADGARYANTDESFVFWSKGSGALVLENNEEKSFIGCISVVNDPGTLPQVYESGSQGFSLRYPTGFAVDDHYTYQALGPSKGISGVKFTIDPTIATGTNLSSDSYVSVEEIAQKPSCDASFFLGQRVATSTQTINGTDYSFVTSSDAGAGNRYEESVYALPGTNPCIAVRYFIHYGAIENYPAGAVKEFDKAALVHAFDTIRDSLTVNQ